LVAGGWITPDGNQIDKKLRDPVTLKYFHKIKDIWQEVKGYIPGEKQERYNWRLIGTRPANYPPRRLAGLSYFLAENLPKGLFAQLAHPIETLTKNPLKPEINHYSTIFPAYQRLLSSHYSDYWRDHFTFGGKTLSKPVKLIGPEKILQIIINVIIPLVLIHARRHQNHKLEEVLHKIYQTAPKIPDNSILRFMTNRIFAGDQQRRALIHSARRQQALLQLFYDYCLERSGDCEGCRFLSLIATPHSYV
jgi:hypothetical protein